jgi:hypothetical protein
MSTTNAAVELSKSSIEPSFSLPSTESSTLSFTTQSLTTKGLEEMSLKRGPDHSMDVLGDEADEQYVEEESSEYYDEPLNKSGKLFIHPMR